MAEGGVGPTGMDATGTETSAEPRTYPLAEPMIERTAGQLLGAMDRIEHDPRWDNVSDRLGTVARAAGTGQRGRVLRGEWLGHALHPLLTDIPLGCWIGAGLLDLVGGRRGRPAAQRLVGLGLLAVPPTAAAGMAELDSIPSDGTEGLRSRRVAAAHAVGNTLVALLYLMSWRARRQGHHLRGVMAGVAGGTLAWITGYLGGHLSFARQVGGGERGRTTST